MSSWQKIDGPPWRSRDILRLLGHPRAREITLDYRYEKDAHGKLRRVELLSPYYPSSALKAREGGEASAKETEADGQNEVGGG